MRPRASLCGFVCSAILLCGCQDQAARTQSVQPLPGQIVVDPNTRAWLAYHGGGPFFLCGPGDPENFLYRGERLPDGTRSGDQSSLISKLAESGANGIYFQAVRSHGGDGEPDHNPFVHSRPEQGLDPDILQQWESWFTALEEAGIVSFFFIYDDSARIWDTGDRVGQHEAKFLTGIVDYFEHHPLLVWVVAEEYEERFSAKRVSNIARVIREADDYNHVIAVHKLKGLKFDEFADDPNIDQFAIQYLGSAQQLHDGMVEAWRNALGRYNLNMSEVADHGTGTTARLKNWAVAMGGAYVMVFKMDIANTTSDDLEDCGRLAKFMESTEFNQMEPNDNLALGDTEYVLSNPGGSYIVYATKPRGKIGLKGLDVGRYKLKWFDPVDGDTVETDVEVMWSDAGWSVPDTIGPEVALYVRRIQPDLKP